MYAVGDVTSVGTPKAGVFSERQAGVVADQLIAWHRNQATMSTYDGTGVCYIEFVHESIGRVEVTFRRGGRPRGDFDDPSPLLRKDKANFGSTRAKRWFGTDWVNY